MPTHFFTDEDDSFTVNAAGDYFLTFLAGDDVLDVRGGTFTAAAMGEGDDRVLLRSGDALIYGESGADRFDIFGGGFEGHGGGDDDLFYLRGGDGVAMFGDGGADRFYIYAAAANVLFRGGDGNDSFLGDGQAISGDIYGDSGDDYFTEFSNAAGGVILHGGTGDDNYLYQAGSSAIFQETVGEGTDTVLLPRGVSYTLGANIEKIFVGPYSGSTLAATTLTGNELPNTIIANNNVDTIVGAAGNDRIYGKGGDDTIDGGDGNDSLDGGNGNDTIGGGGGNDVLNGRGGDDTMSGGSGDDNYYFDSTGDAVIENPGEGIDVIRSTVDIALPDNVEVAVLGGTGNILAIGNTLDNRMYGNRGNNHLDAGVGNDFVHGYGGNDMMVGGSGGDILFGGAGADIFLFETIGDSTASAPDSIRDFETGIDILDVSAIDANALVDGDQAFAIQHMGVPTGTAGELWYSYVDDGAGGYHFTWHGDVDGDRLADLQFDLHSDAAIPHGDWVF